MKAVVHSNRSLMKNGGRTFGHDRRQQIYSTTLLLFMQINSPDYFHIVTSHYQYVPDFTSDFTFQGCRLS